MLPVWITLITLDIARTIIPQVSRYTFQRSARSRIQKQNSPWYKANPNTLCESPCEGGIYWRTTSLWFWEMRLLYTHSCPCRGLPASPCFVCFRTFLPMTASIKGMGMKIKSSMNNHNVEMLPVPVVMDRSKVIFERNTCSHKRRYNFIKDARKIKWKYSSPDKRWKECPSEQHACRHFFCMLWMLTPGKCKEAYPESFYKTRCSKTACEGKSCPAWKYCYFCDIIRNIDAQKLRLEGQPFTHKTVKRRQCRDGYWTDKEKSAVHASFLSDRPSLRYSLYALNISRSLPPEKQGLETAWFIVW